MKVDRPYARPRNASNSFLTALVADVRGNVFELDGYAAVGMSDVLRRPLRVSQTLPMPHGSELMFLPDRRPVVWDTAVGRMTVLSQNPFQPDEPLFPVAAFNSPGYVATAASAYEEEDSAASLPLFSFGAVGWHRGRFRSAVIRVDAEPRQDLRRMPREKVAAGIEQMRRRLPGNRLRRHLETCALTYGCPAAKNFFLGRFEAPLPTAVACNAECLGCLSLQKDSGVPASQQRIGFTPTPDEIAAVALAHLSRVENAVVSFGQGCEGEPLTAARVIEPAIRRIRGATDSGTINMNTNAGRPDVLERLWQAGLDSMRVSLNSVRADCYAGYFRPRGYGFDDVLASIDAALARGRFVSVNYLNLAGFTDSADEAAALENFLSRHPVHMIQWRNLNFDPLRYWRVMAEAAPPSPPIGMACLIERIRRKFPALKHGYFNPPKERFDFSGAVRPLMRRAAKQKKETDR